MCNISLLLTFYLLLYFKYLCSIDRQRSCTCVPSICYILILVFNMSATFPYLCSSHLLYIPILVFNLFATPIHSVVNLSATVTHLWLIFLYIPRPVWSIFLLRSHTCVLVAHQFATFLNLGSVYAFAPVLYIPVLVVAQNIGYKQFLFSYRFLMDINTI